MDIDDTGGERTARRARLAGESSPTHDDPFVNPEFIIREED